MWLPRLLGHKRHCSLHLSLQDHLVGVGSQLPCGEHTQQFICREGHMAKNWGPWATAMFVRHLGSESISPSQAFGWQQPRSWLQPREETQSRNHPAKSLLNPWISATMLDNNRVWFSAAEFEAYLLHSSRWQSHISRRLGSTVRFEKHWIRP